MSTGLAGGEVVAPVPQAKTVAMNSAWTADRLGYFSPAYTRDTKSTGISGHGVVGSIGYTSSSTVVIQPSSFPGARDSSLRLLHAGRAAAAASTAAAASASSTGRSTVVKPTSNGATADAITSTKRANAGRLTKADLDKLQENQKQQQAVYEEWKKQKDAEYLKKKEREKRLKRQDMQRYVQRELRVREEENDRFKEWNLRKGIQEEVAAMERALVVKMTTGIGRRSQAPPSHAMKQREAGFQLHSVAPHKLPTAKTFDATLPRLPNRHQQAAGVAAGRDGLQQIIAAERMRKAQQAQQEAGGAYYYEEGHYEEDDEGYYAVAEAPRLQNISLPAQGGLLPPIDASPPGSWGRGGSGRAGMGSRGADSTASVGAVSMTSSQRYQQQAPDPWEVDEEGNDMQYEAEDREGQVAEEEDPQAYDEGVEGEGEEIDEPVDEVDELPQEGMLGTIAEEELSQ